MRPIAAAVIVLAALLPASAGSQSPAAATGYVITDGSAVAAVRQAGARIGVLSVDGAELRRDGVHVALPGEARAALRAAHALHYRAELLVSNFDERIQDFNARTADALLASPAKRMRLARTLARLAASQGWDGVGIDLENLNRRRDGGGLVALTRALRRALPHGRRLTIDLPAITDPADSDRVLYPARRIAQNVDSVVLMAYSEHDPSGPPGPIEGIPWVRRALSLAKRDVPRSKLTLGIGGYGEHWVPGHPRRSGEITVAQARALVAHASAQPVWDATQAEWHATLPDRSVVWWDDARAVGVRLSLADQLGLPVAIWRLGSADPL